MTHIEVLKLALEALKKAQRQCHYYNIAPHLAYEDAIKALEEALAKQEQGEPAPVGEAFLCDDCQTPFDGAFQCPACGCGRATKEPVYTTPQQRKPLTDEQIDKAMAENKQTLIDAADNYWKMRMAYARIIEAAHGIKE